MKHRFPSDQEILELVEKYGSITEAARVLDVARTTLDSHITRRGLKKDILERLVRDHDPDDMKVSAEEVLRHRVKELESRQRAVTKQDVQAQRILDLLSDAVRRVESRYKPAPSRKGKSGKHEMVLLWSDLHAAEVVSREETNGINEYDWQIMLGRLERLRHGVLSFAENRPYPVDTLHVLGLGDMLSGNIHDELAETNEMPLAEATVQLGLDAADWLAEFHSHFPSMTFTGVVGNHPRAHRKPRAKQVFDNADWTMYQTMKVRLSQHDIDWNIPKAQTATRTVADRWRLLAVHGDGMTRSSMPGVPWGGVMRHTAALQNQYRNSIDLFCMGHWHTANVVEGSGGRVAINGSVKGVDEFSLRAFGSGRNPQQLLLTFHPEKGLTDVSFIDLEDVQPRGLG